MTECQSSRTSRILPHWLGGIPAHIKSHPEPVEWNGLCEEVKGWQLFLEENFVPNSVAPTPQDPDSECSQRRSLVSRWALLSQEARDSYHARAPVRSEATWCPPSMCGTRNKEVADNVPHAMINIIAPQPFNPRQKALWTKIIIMLYYMLFESGIHFYSEGPAFDSAENLAVCVANPAEASITAENFLRYTLLEAACIGKFAMTRVGTVIYMHFEPTQCFVDEETLETGRLLLCEFESNGSLRTSARVWPLVFGQIWSSILAVPFLDRLGTQIHPLHNFALDMELPILDIIDSCKPRLVGKRERLSQDIERIAPGYLALEQSKHGMAPDYDHANFKDEMGRVIPTMLL